MEAKKEEGSYVFRILLHLGLMAGNTDVTDRPMDGSAAMAAQAAIGKLFENSPLNLMCSQRQWVFMSRKVEATMGTLTKIQAEKLTGDALIWAVSHALGKAPVVTQDGVAYRGEGCVWVYPRYTDESEVASLMASEWIGVDRPSRGQTPPQWRAITDNKAPADPRRYKPVVSAWAESIGVAVCRALVLSRLGNEVEVPQELLDSKAA